MNSDNMNEKIIDTVAQTNMAVLGEAAAQAISSLYQVASHSRGLSMEIATIQGITQISAVDTIADAVAIAQILKAG